MSVARTSRVAARGASTLVVTTRAPVRAAIAATLGSSALSTATPPAAAGRERLDQLALGLGHRVDRAELARVRAADVQHRADPRRRDPGEVGDVPDPARGHLKDQVPRRLVGAQHGQRQADLVVERALGRDGRPEALDDLGGEVLGGRLARRPGDADDGRARQPAQDGPREHAEGEGDVGDDDDRRARPGQRPGGEDGRRAARAPPRRRSRGRPRARRAARRTGRPVPPAASRSRPGRSPSRPRRATARR